MWETALAFAIWGSYGASLTAARIDPVLTASVRSAALGILLTLASAIIWRVWGPREITAAIPWRHTTLWLSGGIVLVDEVLYCVSAVNGPVAIIGLAYGCVPVVAPFLSRLAGTDERAVMRPRHWWCLALAFAGNAMIVLTLNASQIRFTLSAVFAFFAAMLFTALPVCSAKLQQSGLGSWAVLKGQGATAAILSVPLFALFLATGLVSLGGRAGDIVARSVAVGAVNALAFSVAPLYLWYRGIARCGVARTAIVCFTEPLVATIFSLVVLKDAPAKPVLVAGVAIVLAAIAISAWPAAEPGR
jgi:drug/metabolite transporter (DMT)-like permease